MVPPTSDRGVIGGSGALEQGRDYVPPYSSAAYGKSCNNVRSTDRQVAHAAAPWQPHACRSPAVPNVADRPACLFKLSKADLDRQPIPHVNELRRAGHLGPRSRGIQQACGAGCKGGAGHKLVGSATLRGGVGSLLAAPVPPWPPPTVHTQTNTTPPQPPPLTPQVVGGEVHLDPPAIRKVQHSVAPGGGLHRVGAVAHRGLAAGRGTPKRGMSPLAARARAGTATWRQQRHPGRRPGAVGAAELWR